MRDPHSAHTAWFQPSEEVLTHTESSLQGLALREAEVRLARNGPNMLSTRERKNPVVLFLKQFLSPLILILFGAALCTALLHEWVNMLVVLAALCVNAGLGFYHEFHAEHTLEKLNTYLRERTRVIREGKEMEIDAREVVLGDILALSYGMRVPADARLVEVTDLLVDEAILTGESLPLSKSLEPVAESAPLAERHTMVHAGTLVVGGFGRAVVVATGINTELGAIARIVSATGRVATPIQKGVSQLSWYILGVTLLIVAAIFILGIVRNEPVLEMLVLSAAVAVGAVPEALPIALTIILAVGAERIARKRGIIRSLSAAETLGSTTLIMTDKTGTLTEAQMQLVGVYTRTEMCEGVLRDGVGERFSREAKLLIGNALRNCDVLIANPELAESEWQFSGRAFEVNIARAAQRHSMPIARFLGDTHSRVIPFNSSHKFSVSHVGSTLYVMGAPDIMLKRSKMPKAAYLACESWLQTASEQGQRLIAVAHMRAPAHGRISLDTIENLTFDGVLAFFDPLRAEVPGAIRSIASYGVRMVLITGDMRGTAVAVARSLGWTAHDHEVLTGADLQTLSDEALIELLPHIQVFARVTPEDKLRVGKLYQTLGEVVAMTGDGVNDAPALKAMDIGISLGSGSDVAKSAADLVLLDDNFKTITSAIEEGRRILGNIRKAFVYLMSNAFDEVCVVGGSLIVGIALPLTALQIIWVNLFTGSLPALAFAFDEHIDVRKKMGAHASSILSREVKTIALGLGTVSSLLLFALYYTLITTGVPAPEARSIFFVCFSAYILVAAFSFRSLTEPLFGYNPFANRALNGAIAIAMSILVITMTVPQIRTMLELAPFPAAYLWLPVVWVVFNCALIEGAKWVFRRIGD